MPSTTSLSPSGRGSRFFPLGSVALNPAAISGVTMMSALTAEGPALPVDMATASHRLLGLEFLGEDRTPELAPHALDEIVDQLLGAVRHLDRQILDLGGEVVEGPHRRDRDDKTDG